MSSSTASPAPAAPAAAAESSSLPHFHILCLHDEAVTAWDGAMTHHSAAGLQQHLTYTIHRAPLASLPPSVSFDAVVSPANSYAILDGGFDDALSRAFSPRTDYAAVTAAARRTLRARHFRGYLPPGACELVDLPPVRRADERYGVGVPVEEDGWEITGSGRGEEKEGDDDDDDDEDDDDTYVRPWGCRYLALCPTMRLPSSCAWDREVVYECIWSLLCAIERHNAEGGGSPIRSVLMTPLGTGTGGISYARWARQTVLAMKHWMAAAAEPDVPDGVHEWRDFSRIQAELLLTQGL